MLSAFIFYSCSSPNLCFDCRKWQQILLLKRSPSPFAFLSFLSPLFTVCHHSEEWLLLPSSGEDAKSCSDKQSVSQAGPPPTKPTAAPTTGIIAFQVLLRLQLKPLEEDQRQQPAAVRLHERKARHEHSDGLAIPWLKCSIWSWLLTRWPHWREAWWRCVLLVTWLQGRGFLCLFLIFFFSFN